jgi:hypothetical protein
MTHRFFLQQMRTAAEQTIEGEIKLYSEKKVREIFFRLAGLIETHKASGKLPISEVENIYKETKYLFEVISEIKHLRCIKNKISLVE